MSRIEHLHAFLSEIEGETVESIDELINDINNLRSALKNSNDLEIALERAESWKGPGPLLIEVHIDPWDASEAFKLMSEALRTK